MAFFSFFALFAAFSGLLVGMPVIIEFMETSYIKKVPSAVLASGLFIISSLSLACGFVLDTVVKQHRQIFELLLNEYRTYTKTSKY
jgi:hypothetical protein